MRFWKDERGQMVPMMALSITTLMGFMALAIDVGVLFHVRREVQIAADAAATAGALDFSYNASRTSATTAAKAAAVLNGVTDGATVEGLTESVSVTFPSGSLFNSPRATGFVQAVVTVPNPTFFMKLFQMSRVTVLASAVAGPGSSLGCIWTLSTGSAAVGIGGSGTLSASSCQVYDDSSSPNAIDSGVNLTAEKVGVTGGSTGSVSPTPIAGMTPVRDPLASLTAPPVLSGTCTGPNCNPSNTIPGNVMTLSPGTYTSITNNSPGGTLTLQPGNYIINGNLTNQNGNLVLGAGNYAIAAGFYDWSSGSLSLGPGLFVVNHLDLTGSGSITGSGVSFYTTGLETTLTGSGNVNLSAPTSGPDNGILIFQARGDATAATIGGPNMNLQGVVYVPSAPLNLSGSGTGTMSADFVTQSLTLSNNTTLQNYAAVNSSDPIASIVMVQ